MEVKKDAIKVSEFKKLACEFLKDVRRRRGYIRELKKLKTHKDAIRMVKLLQRMQKDNREKAVHLLLMANETKLKMQDKNSFILKIRGLLMGSYVNEAMCMSMVWEIQGGTSSSIGWKNLLGLRDSIKQHVIVRIGDGKDAVRSKMLSLKDGNSSQESEAATIWNLQVEKSHTCAGVNSVPLYDLEAASPPSVVPMVLGLHVSSSVSSSASSSVSSSASSSSVLENSADELENSSSFESSYMLEDLSSNVLVHSNTNHDENDSNDDNHCDNLDKMLHDVKRNVDEKNVKKLQQLFVEVEKSLYNGCKKFTKLSLVVKLLDLKVKNNWSDKSFTTLLVLLHEAFLEDNEFPVLMYQARKLTCPMGLEGKGVEIYDAYKKRRFQLFAMVYCTVNDFLAYGNLSGYANDPNRYSWSAATSSSTDNYKALSIFNMIHSKVIDHEKLDELQRDIILILCQLEMYFLPSFFDVMVHLMSHIVEEIKLVGPVFLWYMYLFERYMGFLKGYVSNQYRPEGSMAQAYAAEEVV
nr:hypothetical protein [Tanacetum cinerariifolium]